MSAQLASLMRRVAVAAATLVVCVPGAAFAGDLPDADLLTRAGVRVDGAAADSYTGSSVASAGDFNGDGRRDFIVGAESADVNGRTDSGAAYVIYGPAASAVVDLAAMPTAGMRIAGEASGDYAGRSVAGVGDVNGDGIDDVLVGAPYAKTEGNRTGAAYLVYGQAMADPADVDLAALSVRGARIFGWSAVVGHSVAAAGDFNGDGRDDIIVSRPGMYQGVGACVLYGAQTGDLDDFDLGGLGGRGVCVTGYSGTTSSVSGGADFNGDGTDDVIIGDQSADYGVDPQVGAVYVIYGTATADPPDVDLTWGVGDRGMRISEGLRYDWWGEVVAALGDVNGDGVDDVAAGSRYAHNSDASDIGSVVIVYGDRTADPADVAIKSLGSRGMRIDGASANAFTGRSVADAGDVNDDGHDDIVVGAPYATTDRGLTGAAYVVYGDVVSDLPDISLASLGSAGMRIAGAAIGDDAGTSVAGIGDMNGDGHDDVAIGAARAHYNSRSDAGSAFVFFGHTPPPAVTTSAATDVTLTGATLHGVVNPQSLATTYRFAYGQTTVYESHTTDDSAGNDVTDHDVSMVVSGLSPGTTYHFRIEATNAEGTSVGEDETFTTLPPTPSTTTAAATSVTTTSATLNGTVNANSRATTYRFDYGTSTAYGAHTADADAGDDTADHAVSAVVSGLAPATTYHFRLRATSAGGTTSGTDETFTTTAAPPLATTRAADGVTATGAMFWATVNPRNTATTYRFEFGRTPAYGSTTPEQNAGRDATDNAVSTPITGLQPATVYHFRVVATNTAGATVGADATLTTSDQPVPSPTVAPPVQPTGTSSPAIGPSGSALRAQLLRAMVPPRRVTIRYLVGHRGYTTKFTVSATGRITIRWSTRRRGKSVLLAAGSAPVDRPGTVPVRIKLTPTGARTLRRAKRLVVTATGTYKRPAAETVGATKTFVLSR